MKAEAPAEDQDIEVGKIAAAAKAANEDGGPSALQHLTPAGKWTWSVAEEVGIGVTAALTKNSLGP